MVDSSAGYANEEVRLTWIEEVSEKLGNVKLLSLEMLLKEKSSLSKSC